VLTTGGVRKLDNPSAALGKLGTGLHQGHSRGCDHSRDAARPDSDVGGRIRKYYPGDENLDIVGLSVFGLEQFDIIRAGKPRTFAELVKQGYDLTVGYGKPIWVAELGYEGGLEYLTKWVDDVTKNYPEYPELKEVIYFNDKEVWEWPHNLGLPNWRVLRDKTNYPVRG
jgi:beta-mannanase